MRCIFIEIYRAIAFSKLRSKMAKPELLLHEGIQLRGLGTILTSTPRGSLRIMILCVFK